MLEELKPQGLAKPASASATLGVRHEESLGAIAGKALVRLDELNPQESAKTARALATMGVRQGGELLGAIAGRALVRLLTFKP